jgi:hypothetical protein
MKFLKKYEGDHSIYGIIESLLEYNNIMHVIIEYANGIAYCRRFKNPALPSKDGWVYIDNPHEEFKNFRFKRYHSDTDLSFKIRITLNTPLTYVNYISHLNKYSFIAKRLESINWLLCEFEVINMEVIEQEFKILGFLYKFKSR